MVNMRKLATFSDYIQSPIYFEMQVEKIFNISVKGKYKNGTVEEISQSGPDILIKEK